MLNFEQLASLGQYREAVEIALQRIADANVVQRIWDIDHTVWSDSPTEITNRLGWLTQPQKMMGQASRLQALRDSLLAEGFQNALVLGMGGSSLAPELYAMVFGKSARGLNVKVVDSTDPGAVRRWTREFQPEQTCFVVSSKSGGTVETNSFFKYYFNWVQAKVGTENVGKHFIAITDPGTSLAKLAEQYHFREVFEADPEVGGRYSALTSFGLVPAALVGVDVSRLLQNASAMGDALRKPAHENPGAWLGAVIGTLALLGRDKLTLAPSQSILSFGDWAEQLLAESLGKEGKGLLPVVQEPLSLPESYGHDRQFVHLLKEGDFPEDAALTKLREAGHPVIEVRLSDEYALGGQFMLWGFATSVIAHLFGINPFDQPNVESAKKSAKAMLDTYNQTGALPQGSPLAPDATKLADFLKDAQAGDYITVAAFIEPNEQNTAALNKLRTSLRDQTKLAVTAGYGPRYLHSTGQLHKGDAGRGKFIFLTDRPAEDTPIPDEAGSQASALSFAVLRDSQALGDKQALENEGRPVIHFDLGQDAAAGIHILAGL